MCKRGDGLTLVTLDLERVEAVPDMSLSRKAWHGPVSVISRSQTLALPNSTYRLLGVFALVDWDFVYLLLAYPPLVR